MLKTFKQKLAAYVIDDLTHRKLFWRLSDKTIIYIGFLFKFGKFPNLKNPKTFAEKVQWLKLFGNLDRYTKHTDKYEVRNFIEKTIGKKYLIPLLGVWNKFEDINFDKLPKKFVLKTNHGSYYNFICKDKSKIIRCKLKKKVDKWLSENFYQLTREVQYRDIKPRIICEKYMEDEYGELTDYKIFCSRGKPHLIEVHTDRFGGHKIALMSLDWKRLPIRTYTNKLNANKIINKPKALSEMITVAKKLSKHFPWVRVDLYSVKGKTYFGELTLTPGNGYIRYATKRDNLIVGDIINVSEFTK